MTAALLGLRFLLELSLLASMAIVGAAAFEYPAARALAAVALMLVTAAVWGLLLAPRRTVDLPLSIRVCLEIALFGAAAFGLALSGHVAWGIALFAAEVLVISALTVLGYPPGRRPDPGP